MKTGPFISTLFFAIGAWLEKHRAHPPLWQCAALLGGGLAAHLGEALFLHSLYHGPISNYGDLIGTIPYAVGALLVALSYPNADFFASEFGTYSLGLFTLHPYVIEVLLRLPYGRALSSIPPLFAPLVLVITYALVRPLSKIQWMRPMVI